VETRKRPCGLTEAAAFQRRTGFGKTQKGKRAGGEAVTGHEDGVGAHSVGAALADVEGTVRDLGMGGKELRFRGGENALKDGDGGELQSTGDGVDGH
jgi:hypothetical protein